jgi:UDP-N-acetylglucosamine acyltransferase
MTTPAQIHPTAHVDPAATLHPGVRVGPMCVVGPDVELGEDCQLIASVHIEGPTTIGPRATIYPGAVLGTPPQHARFKRGDKTPGLVIGADAIIREHATIHTAFEQEHPTRIGDRALMMVNSHIGHDCTVGDDVVLVNNSCVGGHCEIGDRVMISGGALVHQFCRIGRHAMISGGLAINADLPPFCVVGSRFRLSGVNLVGMRRAGILREHISSVRKVFRTYLYNISDRKATIAALREDWSDVPPVQEMADFIEASVRGITNGIAHPPNGYRSWATDADRSTTSASAAEDDF